MPIDNNYYISEEVLSDLANSFGDFCVEKAFALFGKKKTIRSFSEITGCSSEISISIDFEYLNNVVEENYKKGLLFLGIAHSHPKDGTLLLSQEDKVFFKDFMQKNDDFNHLLFPVICKINNNIVFKWYLFSKNDYSEIEVKLLTNKNELGKKLN